MEVYSKSISASKMKRNEKRNCCYEKVEFRCFYIRSIMYFSLFIKYRITKRNIKRVYVCCYTILMGHLTSEQLLSIDCNNIIPNYL